MLCIIAAIKGWNETHLSKLNLWRKVYQQHSCEFSNFKPRSMPKWMSSTFNWILLPPHSFSPLCILCMIFLSLVIKILYPYSSIIISDALSSFFSLFYFHWKSVMHKSTSKVSKPSYIYISFYIYTFIYIAHLYFFTKPNRILWNNLFNKLVKYSAMICQKIENPQENIQVYLYWANCIV